MKVFVQALVIFFGTLLVAALVALGRPTQGTQQGFADAQMLARQAVPAEPLVLQNRVARAARA